MLNVSFKPFPALTTERLILRQLERSDGEEAFFLRSDIEVLKYLDKHPSPSLEETLIYIDRITKMINEGEAILWAITLKEETRTIGTICYWRIEKAHYRAEIGYVLHPRYQGKGIMNEAMKAVLNFGFNNMNLHSIEAKVNPKNIASIGLLEKNNFIREGYFKEDYFFDGKFLDTAVYSLLNVNR